MKPIPRQLKITKGVFSPIHCPERWNDWNTANQVRIQAIRKARAGEIGENQVPPPPVHPVEWLKGQIQEYYPSGEKAGEFWVAAGGRSYRAYFESDSDCLTVGMRLEYCGRLDWAPLAVQQALWRGI